MAYIPNSIIPIIWASLELGLVHKESQVPFTKREKS